MKDEIEAAANFLVQLATHNQKNQNMDEEQRQLFRNRLIALLQERFRDHWFPEHPNRGQGYRCIRLNKATCPDPIIEQAANETGLKYSELNLPVELTLWVDPKEVCCRLGEDHGSHFTVASFGNVEERSTTPVKVPKRPVPLPVTTHPSQPVHHSKCYYPNFTANFQPLLMYPRNQTSMVDYSKPSNPHRGGPSGNPWGRAYVVPVVPYFNNWHMGQMVKV